jgi:hypothetical protein
MLNPPTAPIPTQDFTNNTAQLPANFNDIVKMAGPSQDPVISEEIPRVVLALPSQDPINENITKSNSDTEED